MMVEAAGHPVLFAWIEPAWYGAKVLWADAAHRVSVLPPWSAAECRDLDGDAGRWLHEIRHRLRGDLSPLHAGEWALEYTVSPPPGHLETGLAWLAEHLIEGEDAGDARSGYIDFFCHMSGTVVLLRRLSPPDAPRAKAQLRLAREGALAPIVLLGISGLSGAVVLDGHDRIVAALAEGVAPRFIFLERTDSIGQNRRDEAAVAWYERTMASLERAEERAQGRMRDADEQRSRIAMRFAAEFETEYATPTRAWPMGADEWDTLTAVVSPAWLDERRDEGMERP